MSSRNKTKNIKAIIIAAGMGNRLNPLTNDKPKCLLEVVGKTILKHQIDTFKSCGITDISVVKGYKKEKINYPDLKYYINNDYQNNNILNSLFYAEKEMEGEFLVTYSDIIFDKGVVEKLLKSKRDIFLVVDVDWQDYYIGRTKHPVQEAEKVVIQGGKIIKIGKHLTVEEADGEFIGMAKFSKEGGEIFRKEFQRVKKEYWGKPFQKAEIFERAYLTDMLQELIDRGINIYPVIIKKQWWEIDTEQDLRKVREILA